MAAHVMGTGPLDRWNLEEDEQMFHTKMQEYIVKQINAQN